MPSKKPNKPTPEKLRGLEKPKRLIVYVVVDTDSFQRMVSVHATREGAAKVLSGPTPFDHAYDIEEMEVQI